MTSIPHGLLDTLSNRWAEPNGYTAFDSNFVDDRRSDPARYIHRAGTDGGMLAFTADEMIAIAGSGAIDGLHRIRPGTIEVNEHAEHALADFCRETYEAWNRCRRRLDEARAHRYWVARAGDEER